MGERRAHKHRIDVGADIEIIFGDKTIPARVLNVSFGGALFGTEERPPVGSEIEIHADNPPTLQGLVVRHTAQGFAMDFGETLDAAQFALNSITSDMQVGSADPSEDPSEDSSEDPSGTPAVTSSGGADEGPG